jgi:PilZ domain
VTLWKWMPRSRKATGLAFPEGADYADRRHNPRYRCRLACACNAISLMRLSSLGTGWVQDISAEGLRLVLRRPVPPGTFLSLRLQTLPGQLIRQLRAQVIRSSRFDNEGTRWVVGCKFSPHLSEVELDAML